MTELTFSICIPAYNRSNVLGELLESVLSQDYAAFEVVIGEDQSQQRSQIRDIVVSFQKKYPDKIIYFENKTNLGFDGNIRKLIETARGEYCVFMGNDDLMCSGALKIINSVISRYHKIGVYLRSYAAFDGNPDRISRIARYFDREIFFPAGARTISTFYKRCVVIPGVTLNRQAALNFATDRFDGTLLYQIYLVANILLEWNGVFSPEIVTLYRDGGVPEFGSSEAEKDKFIPGTRTTESSLHFMEGMLKIAGYVEETRHVDIYKSILRDISNYSYPVLSVQADKPFAEFFRYYFDLNKLGFGRQPLFHFYFWLIVMLGTRRLEKIMAWIKNKKGYTPILGSVYAGEDNSKPWR